MTKKFNYEPEHDKTSVKILKLVARKVFSELIRTEKVILTVVVA